MGEEEGGGCEGVGEGAAATANMCEQEQVHKACEQRIIIVSSTYWHMVRNRRAVVVMITRPLVRLSTSKTFRLNGPGLRHQ